MIRVIDPPAGLSASGVRDTETSTREKFQKFGLVRHIRNFPRKNASGLFGLTDRGLAVPAGLGVCSGPYPAAGGTRPMKELATKADLALALDNFRLVLTIRLGVMMAAGAIAAATVL